MRSAMNQNFPRIPKVKEHVELHLTNGETHRGYMFMEVTSRVQDVLNSPNRFFPFIHENSPDGKDVQLVNKDTVSQVIPYGR